MKLAAGHSDLRTTLCRDAKDPSRVQASGYRLQLLQFNRDMDTNVQILCLTDNVGVSTVCGRLYTADCSIVEYNLNNIILSPKCGCTLTSIIEIIGVSTGALLGEGKGRRGCGRGNFRANDEGIVTMPAFWTTFPGQKDSC